LTNTEMQQGDDRATDHVKELWSHGISSCIVMFDVPFNKNVWLNLV